MPSDLLLKLEIVLNEFLKLGHKKDELIFILPKTFKEQLEKDLLVRFLGGPSSAPGPVPETLLGVMVIFSESMGVNMLLITKENFVKHAMEKLAPKLNELVNKAEGFDIRQDLNN